MENIKRKTMKELQKLFSPGFTIPLLLSCFFCTFCLAERDLEPCQFFPNNTNIRNPADCSQGLTCINFKSVVSKKCSGSTPFYDKDKGNCVKSLVNDTTCSINCTDSKGQFLADPMSCYGYYFCQEDNWPRYGHCPQGYHFDGESQTCIYDTVSNCSVNSLNFCAIVKNTVNFNDPRSCEKYYVCKSGNLTSVSCKNTYFEPATGKCIQKSWVNCPAHPYPANVCGTASKPKKNVFVADGATCRGSFYCKAMTNGADTAPLWTKCPENTFFSDKEKKCVSPLEVSCTEDRCDGRTLTFVSSGKKGCRHYLRCSNGVMVEELSCGNKFFDEKAGVCTSEVIQYPSCLK